MIFRNWVLQNFPFLEDDFDALTDYELFCKMIEYMKKALDKIKDYQAEIDVFTVKLNEFQHYFDNLDVTEEVNAKLDEMVEDGTMEQLIAQYLQLQTTYTYNTIAELKLAENMVNGMLVRTSGYYSFNDGGGAYYKVRNVLVSDVIDDMLIIGLNSEEVVAELIQGNIINVNQLGAYGDGTHDDTIAIQTALNTDSNVIFNSGSTYLVSKNTDLDFTGNDEPCLLINKEKTIYGNGATLVVNEHGQGILEISDTTNVIIDNLVFKSNGEQLPLDGTSGLGEKGNSSYGYQTDTFFGVYLNNSYDTSAFTTHGNGGNAWGTFNDGFIGNAANGITISNDSHNITIKNCEIYGFNYAGIEISPYRDRTANNPISTNITIINNKIHNIYDAGIIADRCEYVNIENNNIYSIGHEDALYTNTNQNPGYGITIDQSFNSIQGKDINIQGNIINNCVRKGIDLHGGESIIISGNIVRNCMYGGIFSDSLQTSGISKKLIISNNEVSECSYSTNRGDPIWTRAYHGDSITEPQFEKNVIINSNLVENCGCERAFITFMLGFNCIISNNMIKGVHEHMPSSQTIHGILAGTFLSGHISKNIKVSNNLISVPYTLDAGVTTWYVEDCIVNDNIIDCTNTTPTNKYSTSESKVHCYGNFNTKNSNANIGNGGFALTELSNTTNLGDDELGITANHLTYKYSSKIHAVPTMINLTITANNTSSPTISVKNGSEFISSVVSETNGLTINLTGIDCSNASVHSQFTSSYPFHEYNTTTYWPFIYNRGVGSSAITLGIKRGTGDGGQHLPIASADSGTLQVTILV